jgi:hypothetical protein
MNQNGGSGVSTFEGFDDDGVDFGKSECQASSLHKLTAFPLGIVFSTYELPFDHP